MAEWFKDWFDSPYYHILYAHRDDREARHFIENLVGKMELAPGAKVLDLACGKGRHARFLNELGFDVMGADLSEASIRYARVFENPTLRFVVHDMREPLGMQEFDLILNLFTSFGYFENDTDNLALLRSVRQDLGAGGRLVIDFLNAVRVTSGLVPEETREMEGIVFHINRRISDGFIVKDIAFEDDGKSFHYTEKVRLFTLDDFRAMFEKTGFHCESVAGDYNLGKFDADISDRLILTARKQ